MDIIAISDAARSYGIIKIIITGMYINSPVAYLGLLRYYYYYY